MPVLLKVLLSLSLLIIFSGCTRSVHLDVVRETSDLMRAHIVFGESIHSIKYLKEFWLQIGEIDTTTEQLPIRAAIIVINNKEIVMDLLTTLKTDGVIAEIYSGNSYELHLSYTEKVNEYHEHFYQGNFTLKHLNQKSEHSVIGMRSIL